MSNKRRKWSLILTGIAILLVAVGGTYAWWVASLQKDQEVTMGNLKIKADFAELEDPIGYEPGLTAEIGGRIENKGTIPAMIKLNNNSEIKFVYSDDQLTPIPEAEQKFIKDGEEAIKLSVDLTGDSDEAYFFKDSDGGRYILLEIGGFVDTEIVAEFDGNVMGNKYQDSIIRIGAKLDATQVLNGAMQSQFGVTTDDLTEMDTSTNVTRTKRGLSKGEQRLQELVSRGK